MVIDRTDIFIVTKEIPGYTTAEYAKKRIHRQKIVVPGKYYVYMIRDGMINISLKLSCRGDWINPLDNVVVERVQHLRLVCPSRPVEQIPIAVIPDLPIETIKLQKVYVGRTVRLKKGCLTYDGKKIPPLATHLAYKIIDQLNDTITIRCCSIVKYVVSINSVY